MATACTSPQITETDMGQYILVTQSGGATLGYSPTSGVKLIKQDGYRFKNLNRNGVLDKYEDWRLSFNERTTDLASQLSIEEIAGLMLYSAHQAVLRKVLSAIRLAHTNTRELSLIQ